MKKIKCLIIDDDKKIRESLTHLINEFFQDYTIEQASNGQEGIDKLTSSSYDLVLTDYEMSPKNGLDVLEYMYYNKIDALSVMITSHANPVTWKGSLKFRVAGFIEKPINPNAFMELFDKLNSEIIEKHKRQTLENIGVKSAMILHDIRNPLTIIMGSSILLPKKIDNEITQDFCHKIIQSSEKIISIIDDTQQVMRDGQIKTNVNQKFNLNELEHLMQDLIKYKDVDFPITYEMKDVNVKLSSVQMFQIFTNLVNNSLDAISDQEPSKKWIKFYIKDETANKITIAIQDSGNGILKEEVPKLFDRMYSKKKNDLGTGLGLFIIRDLLKVNNGSIDYNDESKNTEFLISLEKTR